MLLLLLPRLPAVVALCCCCAYQLCSQKCKQNVNKHLTKNRSNRKAKSESSISSRWNNNKFHAKRSRSVIAQAIAALQTA